MSVKQGLQGEIQRLKNLENQLEQAIDRVAILDNRSAQTDVVAARDSITCAIQVLDWDLDRFPKMDGGISP